ncbi:class I SAM-dependent methyltransferase [Rhodovarius crocodyli]|uniref:class I SAM-dependent methyltransferase n=1 Tax=Rhodovarius crocodyli TaxID=1979269 RepID=UPI0038D0E12D
MQTLIRSVLGNFTRQGRLNLRLPDGTTVALGPPGEAGSAPVAGMHLKTANAIRRLVLDPAMAFGELYMDGEIEPLDCSIHDLLRLLTLNQAIAGDPGLGRWLDRLRRLARRSVQLNPAGRSKRNVAHHYDLNGQLYAFILDEDRQYSCAYFRTGRETLEEAQRDKKRHIAAKLRLDRPGLEVLDIGCGWGGMALTLARDHGARVTGVTLSEEQLAHARARAQAEGLQDRVRFELMDYRAWDRPVDRVVSVGMVEHVGINHFATYFGTIARHLKEDGVALVHGIGRSDGPGTTNPWMQKYIFPGGYSPALSEVVPAVEKAGLWVTDIEVLRLHYARTLAEWRARFLLHREEIKALYDERFCRMFEMYLSGSEFAFRHGGHMVWQVQLARRVDALPLTRDYMLEEERAAQSLVTTRA